MVAAIPEAGETKRHGPAVLLLLLLSLFAVSPSWAVASANSNPAVVEADTECASGIADSSKRAKPAQVSGFLGAAPGIVTQLPHAWPAEHGDSNPAELTAHWSVSAYNARAPPAL